MLVTVAVKSMLHNVRAGARARIGKGLIGASLALLAVWVSYFVNLARPIDLWDYSPLPVLLALLLIGFRLVRSATSQLMRLSTIFGEE